ncbi:MAG: hypothetical protein NE327_20450 [Lentisphaeraceae bacterium]|nr:hypothetical protein [Lentisphaeraceae bacterium]
MNWNFDQAQNVAAITTKQVMKEGLPILQVIHYSDDNSWAFMCGTTWETGGSMVVSMAQVVSTDDSLHEIADLPVGWVAERESVEGEWKTYKDDEV